MRQFEQILGSLLWLAISLLTNAATSAELLMTKAPATRPNFLIITVDDMSCDSVGVFGCSLEETTPHIDQFALSGMRFQYAHVQTGSCNPSRNVMFSGLYSHNTKVEGFYDVPDADYPHLVDLMKGAGYFVAIRGKVTHSTPYHPYAWDADLTTIDGEKQALKEAASYFRSTAVGIDLASKAGKPFCINVNISDPHKPFYGVTNKGEPIDDPHVPTRIFRADEVPIPGFLFDHPKVRTELAHYYSSVRRADDCFAEVMRALEASGKSDDTIVIFLSDHGMPLPFAKTAAWHHSTHTPWIVRWPSVTKPGSVDNQHMISAVDLLPTILEIVGVQGPDRLDGKSFASTLHGESQSGRDYVFKFHNENSGGNRSPIRAIQSKRFLYLFNPWSDGKRVFKTATTGTDTYRTMQVLADSDPKMKIRLDFFNHRVLEEFYDIENDPHALVNLINDPAYANEIAKHQGFLRNIMRESKDPCLEAFEKRGDRAFVSAYVDKLQAEADQRSKRSRRNLTESRKQKQDRRLFDFIVPKSLLPGEPIVVEIKHELPKRFATQSFHVTLKAKGGKRLQRKIVSAKGTGEFQVEFAWPENYDEKSFQFAAFVGKDFSTCLLHRTAGPVPISD